MLSSSLMDDHFNILEDNEKKTLAKRILDFFSFELRPFSDIRVGVGWAIFPSSSLECQCLKSVVRMWIPEMCCLSNCVILRSSKENPDPWHCFLKMFLRAESFYVLTSDKFRNKSIDNPFQSIDNPFYGLESLEQLEIALDLMSKDFER